MTQHRENLRVELVDWVEAEPAIRAIREAVFIAEQAVPEELEWDGLDSSCAHVLAWNDRGVAIGTARMKPQGIIGRMAVLKDWRARRGMGPPSDIIELGCQAGPVARDSVGSDPRPGLL